jgi:hypothetical protein
VDQLPPQIGNRTVDYEDLEWLVANQTEKLSEKMAFLTQNKAKF